MKRTSSSLAHSENYDHSEDDSNLSSTQENLIPDADLTNLTERQRQQRFQHKEIERNRRLNEQRHFEELSRLLPHWYDSNSSKLTQINKLELAADLLTQMNANQSNQLFPSYLTQDEKNFLDIEANNSFLFVTTLESSIFRIVHVSDSIYRVLQCQPSDWMNKNFLSLIHLDDKIFIEHQLLNSIKTLEQQISFKCRLDRGDNSYLSVHIDGMIKKLNQSILTIPNHQQEYYAFVGICHLPLVSLYSQRNRDLHKNTQINAFMFRCTPDNWQDNCKINWKIFLVDGLAPAETFRNKSILDFICNDDRLRVHQILYEATTFLQEQSIFCNFIYPSGDISTVLLKVQPMIIGSNQKLDYLELSFEDYTNRVNDSEDIQ